MKVIEIKKELPEGMEKLIRDIIENPKKYRGIFIAYEFYGEHEERSAGCKHNYSYCQDVLGLIEMCKGLIVEGLISTPPCKEPY